MFNYKANYMTIYTDKIIVSFFDNEECKDEYLELRFCPFCKMCKDKELFRSFNNNVDYNKTCRRCLDKAIFLKVKRKFYQNF